MRFWFQFCDCKVGTTGGFFLSFSHLNPFPDHHYVASLLLPHLLELACLQYWDQYVLISQVKSWPDFIGMVTGCLPSVQESLQLKNIEDGVVDGVIMSPPDRRSGCVPGEQRHEGHGCRCAPCCIPGRFRALGWSPDSISAVPTTHGRFLV